MLHRIGLSLALIGSSFLFGADSNHQILRTLVVSPTEKYYVSKASFDASLKRCVLDGKIVRYGNVLCAERHTIPKYYVIKELWYRVKEVYANDVPIQVVSKRDWCDDTIDWLSLDTKQKALQYLSNYKPNGLDSKECVFKGGLGFFVAPQNAVLLCLLQKNDKSAFEHTLLLGTKEASIFCVSERNELSHLYFVKNDLKVNDQEREYDACALSRSIGIPKELQTYFGKKFKNQEKALKALKKHIDKTYFNAE